jgi:D-arabinan exo alpha-(1,3)/(1,5)-arabinofuranosidase (non-reducing end)
MLNCRIDNLQKGRSKRISSYDRSGSNADFARIPAKSSYILADVKGPGRITHIWMTSWGNYRNMMIKMTWDDAKSPSVYVPYGDFFGQGNCIVNSYQSAYFTSSTDSNNKKGELTALNCYLPMPFKKRALIELINDSEKEHTQYFYIDYEQYEDTTPLGPNPAYLHAEFRRQNPFGGWGPEIKPNASEVDSIVNLGEDAWQNNYVLMETQGKGHYLGCFFSVANLKSKSFANYSHPDYWWWGEGDDMIWVDGYKWPPDLHGTGSEDYFNQALGMQRNAFLRNGTTIHEFDTDGFSTSYIFHIENPVRFQKEIKVTIENGHANHLGNDISSVAFWYAETPTEIASPPPVEQRQPLVKENGEWLIASSTQITEKYVPITSEMQIQKKEWKRKQISKPYKKIVGPIFENKDGILSMNVQMFTDSILEIPFEEVLDDLIDDSLPTSMDGKNINVMFNVFGKIHYFPLSQEMIEIMSAIEPELRKKLNIKLKIVCGAVLDEEKVQNTPAEICVIFTDKLSFRD